MDSKTTQQNISFLSGGGEMGHLIRTKDWSKTPIGHPDSWDQSLRTTLSIILNSKFPMFLFWGKDLLCFYNDAYRPSLGNDGKHPDVLGNPAKDHWQEIWDDIKPLIDSILAGGEANWSEDQLLSIYRNGKVEDVYWTFSYSAVYDETGLPAGVFVTCYETTNKVVAVKDLKEREYELTFTIDAAELATWDINPQTNSMKANQRLREWFGLSLENEINVDEALQIILDEDRQKVVDALQAALQPGSDGHFQIEESAERFHTLADNLSQLVWMADEKGSLYWYNKRWYDYTGTTFEEMQGWGWQKVHHPNHVDRVITKVQQSWDLGEVWEDTFPLRGQDGLYRWFLTRVFPIKDDDGKVLRWFGTNTDITEQKILIEKLNATVNKLNLYEKTVVNIKDAVIITEAEPFNEPGPRIVYVNDAFYQMTGFTPDEVIGKTPRILQGPKTDRQELDKIRKALENWEPVRVEVINYKKDGTEFYVEFEIVPVANEKGWFTHWVSVQRNITERKEAEEKIRNSENRFRNLADNSPMWILMVDENVNLNYANTEMLKFVGAKDYSEITGHLWEKLVHPDDIQVIFHHFREASALKNAFDFECRVINSATGLYEWFYMKGIPRLEGNNFIGFIGTAINIQEQKQQLETIKESEADFRTLAETLPQLIWVTDENGNQLYASKKWNDYTGVVVTNQESWRFIVHPDDFDNINQTWAHCLASGSIYKCDVRLRNKQGEYRWFTVNGEPVLNNENKIIKWVGAFTDIHTDKEFAQELKKQVDARTNELQIINETLLLKNELLTISENFNRTLTDVSPTMVYIHDIEKNRPVFLNSTYLKFIGYTWEEVEELGDDFFKSVIHPDDIKAISEVTAKIKDSKPSEVFESNSHRKNTEGVWVPFLNRLTAFKRNSQNEVTQFIGVAIDISELKQAKDVLQQKNIDLENMNNELQSFAYVSSHDLQEPLRKIQTFSTRILEKEYENISDSGKNYFNRMQSAAARMQQLIQDLLAFSRVNSTERVFENTDLKQIVEDLKEELKEELQQKNAVIEIDNLSEIQIIPFQFRQLLHNLIGNSLKFSKTETPPHIRLSSEKGKGITFNIPKLNPDQNYCHITIKDNGIGFQKEYNNKIFEVFQRLHGKDEYSGTGIGLAIVKKIVDNHNGIITAQGEVGKGATFDIYIPSN